MWNEIQFEAFWINLSLNMSIQGQYRLLKSIRESTENEIKSLTKYSQKSLWNEFMQRVTEHISNYFITLVNSDKYNDNI